MTLTRWKVISVIGIFLLCFLTHFIYDWFPNTFTSIFFPVNESIWEHMKMLYSAMIVFGLIEFPLLKLFKLNHHNFLTNLFISSLLSIPIFLTLYLPFYYIIGENMALNLITLFITICITQIIGYYTLNTNKSKGLNWISLIGIILVYIIFGILTYYPLEIELFFDPIKEKYGLNTYVM